MFTLTYKTKRGGGGVATFGKFDDAIAALNKKYKQRLVAKLYNAKKELIGEAGPMPNKDGLMRFGRWNERTED